MPLSPVPPVHMNVALRSPSRWPSAAAALLALTVATTAGSGGLDAQEENVRFPDLPADAAAGTGDVESCGTDPAAGDVRCGVFRVLENRDEPGGRTLDLHFVVLRATDAAARTDDPVLFFFGGPGAPAIGAAPYVAGAYADLRRRRDLLLVDLRGIGRSGGLTCDVPYPGGFVSRFGSIFDARHLAACREHLSRRADLTRYTTPASVDDLEELRRWLGYASVNLDGTSYGTRVVQVYLRRYPEVVRTAVLNGVLPVSEPGYVRMSPNLQAALEKVITACGRQAGCAAAYPDLDRQVERAFARLADGPVGVDVEGREVPFHAADLGYALRGLLYGRSAEVPYRIAQAARGEFAELAAYYVERTDWVSGTGAAAGNHLSVLCAEDIRPVTDADVRRAAAGTFLRGEVIRAYRAACDAWPEAELPAGHFEPVTSDVPALLVSGEQDPVTPPENAERVSRGLRRSVHVVVPGGGHGVTNDCVLGMITRFVEAATPDVVDAACVSDDEAIDFRLPSAAESDAG